jgi:type I restriction enzyme M protein
MRAVVVDALSGREIIAGPEERDATQPFVAYLVQKLGWHPRQMITRPQWRVPKSPSSARSAGYPVDIAIFDSPDFAGDSEHVRIIVECKAPSEETGIEELKTYLGLEPEARLGIWFNGERHVLVWKLARGFTIDRYGVVPRPTDPLSPTEAHPPLRYSELVPPPNLRDIFRRLRDRIAAQDTHVNRDEFILNDLANLLICKIADEQEGELAPERQMAFQLAGTRAATAEAVRRYFTDVKKRLPSVFTDPDERLHVDDASLEEVIKTLQPYRILGHDRHAVGTAFQVLRGRALKGDEGAYFTPPPLVDCVVSILDPDHSTRLVDPACGTGGFLAAALDHVFSGIDERSDLRSDAKRRAKTNWAADYLYAVDKDAVSTKLCKAYLTLLGDGRAHVYRADTIDRGDWKERSDSLIREVADDRFHQVMTNPPFGSKLKVDAEVGRAEGLLTCRVWEEHGGVWEPTEAWTEQQLGIAFFERNLGLLMEGGRMAIVLPETFLFSASFRWFVDWVCRTLTVTHVIDVPMVAFEEFCRAKTCLLFVQKTVPSKGHQVVMSFPRSLGQDKKGRPLYKLDGQGQRTDGADLDNEMAEAVSEIVSGEYGRAKGRRRGGTKGSRLAFPVRQSDVRKGGVLVPRFWWRKDTDEAMASWVARHPGEVVTLGDLEEEGVIAAFSGHGSPPGNARGTGSIPYVKVTDLKNWRVNENPTNYIHESVANQLRSRGPRLEYGDLVGPARASSNIGQFSLILPWQTDIVLTREVLILRVQDNARGMDAFLLLALMSLKVVQGQYANLALMQTNREHLGDNWREVQIPIPSTKRDREKVARPVREYFGALVAARDSYNGIFDVYDSNDFGTRP